MHTAMCQRAREVAKHEPALSGGWDGQQALWRPCSVGVHVLCVPEGIRGARAGPVGLSAAVGSPAPTPVSPKMHSPWASLGTEPSRSGSQGCPSQDSLRLRPWRSRAMAIRRAPISQPGGRTLTPDLPPGALGARGKPVESRPPTPRCPEHRPSQPPDLPREGRPDLQGRRGP